MGVVPFLLGVITLETELDCFARLVNEIEHFHGARHLFVHARSALLPHSLEEGAEAAATVQVIAIE